MRKTAKTPNWSYIRKDSQIPIDRAAFWCAFYCSYLHLHTFLLFFRNAKAPKRVPFCVGCENEDCIHDRRRREWVGKQKGSGGAFLRSRNRQIKELTGGSLRPTKGDYDLVEGNEKSHLRNQKKAHICLPRQCVLFSTKSACVGRNPPLVDEIATR